MAPRPWSFSLILMPAFALEQHSLPHICPWTAGLTSAPWTAWAAWASAVPGADVGCTLRIHLQGAAEMAGLAASAEEMAE